MLKKYGFFDSDWNENGNGFDNKFEAKSIKADQIINDSAAGLIWQKSGSSNEMRFEDAKQWIREINRKKFASFNDWRLPTLEEAMSLMKPKEINERYLDPIFDRKQFWIWTADMVKSESIFYSSAWIAYFNFGNCNCVYAYDSSGPYVRAVRSVQSS